MLIFNVIFCFLAVQIYVEFGWKLYKFVNCNPALRCERLRRERGEGKERGEGREERGGERERERER